MKRFTTLALLLICIVSFDACKKYEDGPMFSLRSAKARLSGEWKVTTFTWGGENQLNYVESNSSVCASGSTQTWNNTSSSVIKITFDKSGTLIWDEHYTSSFGQFDYFNCIVNLQSDTYNDALGGTWVFTDKKKSVTMIVDTEAIELDIKRLTNKEIELQGVVDGEVIAMSLEAED